MAKEYPFRTSLRKNNGFLGHRQRCVRTCTNLVPKTYFILEMGKIDLKRENTEKRINGEVFRTLISNILSFLIQSWFGPESKFHFILKCAKLTRVKNL